jgi:dTDP-4-dehydrorhamnose 3,5-epimerase-like enzyme
MTDDLWNGLRHSARSRLSERDYNRTTLAERLGTTGIEAGELLQADDMEGKRIPGVEVLSRRVYIQENRGFFAEFAREDQGLLGKIGLWPRQWATATMWAGSGKGFHIHPPFVPEGSSAEGWFRQLYLDENADPTARPYDKEQWDVMFFVHGCAEMILVDERAGLDRRIMRLRIDGDNHRGPNNVGVVIPAGVAHAIRAEGGENVIMVYGTSTPFNPAFEGRIENSLEKAPLPTEWQDYLFD